jgi:hypothetical protein
MLWVAMLAGALLAVAGIVGSRPRPSDGRWIPMSPSLRAGLTMIGLVAIVVGLALLRGWFKPAPGAPAPRPYAVAEQARADRPTDTLWNEAEVAQREARIRELASGEPPVESSPAPAPAAVTEQPVPAPPVAEAVAVPPAAAPAPAVPPPKKKVAARIAKDPDCDCDAAAPAAKPGGSRSRNAGASPHSDTVSVCALQRQYGIGQ